MRPSVDQVVLRPPTPADVEAAARCHLACWQEAYAELIDAERLTAITNDLDWALGVWRKMLTSDRTVVLAADDDHVVGFATAGPASEPGLDVALHLYAINVRRAYWGSGLGQRLLNAVLGDREAFLWVFRDNPRARAFYVRNGFVPDGVEQIEDFFGGAIEIRMVRRR
ncbi:MAG TPA: GNAT family N-acetyltransferase [Propionibacteriaceae bacterium]